MSYLHYLDFEVPLADEGWTAAAGGTATTERTAAAAFPDRGSYGFRATSTVSPDRGYVAKTISQTFAAGSWLYLGFWARANARGASSTTYIFDWEATGSEYDGFLKLQYNGQMKLYCRRDNATYASGPYAGELTTSWSYIVIAFKRASTNAAADGELTLYQDGHRIASATGIDNYDRYASISHIELGLPREVLSDGWSIDIDEVKIGTSLTDVQPFSPSPTDGELPEAARTIVLWRVGSADSREFAEYCHSQIGVPLSHLVPLPSATATESLADYATFETEVEDDLNAWLANNPAIAAKVSTIIIGYGVPGYFSSGGIVHSAASRLMNLSSAFSSKTANPLYNPATPGRLTKTALSSAGLYLCTRIDADTLAQAKAIIDASAAVSALTALPDTDILYTDENTSTPPLWLQHLRLSLDGISGADGSDAAFVTGNLASISSFAASGSRAAIVDDADEVVTTLRAPSSNCVSGLLTYGYAAAMGWSNFTDIGFNDESFFEALRVGCTFAEAAIQSIKYVDYTAMPLGDPLMTVAFSATGHNIYRGNGDISTVNWAQPAGYLPAGASSVTLNDTAHAAGATYTYVVRPVLNGVEGADLSCSVDFTTNPEGQWLGARPVGVESVEAVKGPGGSVELTWSYRTPYGFEPPVDFALYCSSSPGISAGSWANVKPYIRDGEYFHTFALADGQACYFAVSARNAQGMESTLSLIVGPVVADAQPPITPVAYVSGGPL